MRLILVSAAGAALFAWPFLGLPAPAFAPALAVALAAVAAVALLETGARRLDARGLALLAAIAAVDAALRMAVVTGIGGFSPIFFLVLCAGFALGADFGFLAGALALLVSAVATGGIGPWLPYQVFATGWVGALAGVAGRPWRGAVRGPQLAVLAGVGIVTGYAFGALMDVWDWSSFFAGGELGWSPGMAAGRALTRFARFYAATSFAYDSFRAAGNAAAVLLLGAPVVAALRRMRARMSFEVVPAAVNATLDSPA